ncbi:hypothetical protein SY88_12345 [Clostridiales bacterium PH28_bin88]|nr:hypothetical protein SY88_12345 [Clostridiales bacterium PH28_bin88]
MTVDVPTSHRGLLPLRLFSLFFRIGAFTIGGGYAMVPLIEKEVVGRGWLSEEEFLDTLAVAQTVPGVLAVNTGLYVGYRAGGLAGALTATLGAVLPSFLIILAIAMFIPRYQQMENIRDFFKGAQPVVVALLAGAAYFLGRKSVKSWRSGMIALVTLVAVWFYHLDPILALIAGGIAGGVWLQPAPVVKEGGEAGGHPA